MIDEPLPTPSGIDAESEPTDGESSEEDPNARRPDAERPARESEAGPDRATDPPPDSGERNGIGDSEPESAGGEGDTDGDGDESEPLEYRLERLRLWRTVVTLAVVVGRLIRSF